MYDCGDGSCPVLTKAEAIAMKGKQCMMIGPLASRPYNLTLDYFVNGQRNGKGASLAQGTFRADASAVFLCEIFAENKPKP